jgi:hypothetical protein
MGAGSLIRTLWDPEAGFLMNIETTEHDEVLYDPPFLFGANRGFALAGRPGLRSATRAMSRSRMT